MTPGGAPNGLPLPNGLPASALTQPAPPPAKPPAAPLSRSTILREQIWVKAGNLHELFEEPDQALKSYENALRHNPNSVPALTQIAALYRARDDFAKAVDYFQRIISIEPNNGEVWGAVGHCFLMTDSLSRAYTAYQQALYHMPNPKEPKLWYGIGILYDRFGSFDHAEEAFSAVMKIDPKFEKANEIYFRLGIIYKSQGRYAGSLGYFRYILDNPPKPLTATDIWFQIGHVHELAKEFPQAKEAYERVLTDNPEHSKVLQQLGWLYAQPGTGFTNPETALSLLTRCISADETDAQSWYLLGRCYMSTGQHAEAYDCYQQAVYRDSSNAHFWCSIGVLYFQISQYRDALDAYSRALRYNAQLSEVWHNLGTLYETCNNQVDDAINAYVRALDVDPNNEVVKQRLSLLQHAQSTGTSTNIGTVPTPQDPAVVHSQPATAGPGGYLPPGNPPQLDGPPPGPPHTLAPNGMPSGGGPPRLAAPGSPPVPRPDTLVRRRHTRIIHPTTLPDPRPAVPRQVITLEAGTPTAAESTTHRPPRLQVPAARPTLTRPPRLTALRLPGLVATPAPRIRVATPHLETGPHRVTASRPHSPATTRTVIILGPPDCGRCSPRQLRASPVTRTTAGVLRPVRPCPRPLGVVQAPSIPLALTPHLDSQGTTPVAPRPTTPPADSTPRPTAIDAVPPVTHPGLSLDACTTLVTTSFRITPTTAIPKNIPR
ncbi:glucose repression mediator protein [Tieghemiomyces parasiticus]|uniref:Glucose repression mediator protein n=1 Tax=Tieghemiomyces parasiticus TaxID=78921 RepID=A0A9W7ZXE0_9FUNG|nr:glucose repression mediator protein [Tieghemiomyces parasiticus]